MRSVLRFAARGRSWARGRLAWRGRTGYSSLSSLRAGSQWSQRYGSTSTRWARSFATEEKEAEVVEEVPKSDAAIEKKKGSTKSQSFQAETRQILDIMAKSLYTDKEVFLRELISNASDACEKARYLQSSATGIIEEEEPFALYIDVDDKNNTLTIRDTGVGMDVDELQSNLGTIARSGSKAFRQSLQDGNADSIIGQFGVGFYSTFMVADRVEVFSKPAAKDASGTGYYWTSDGDGTYEVGEADGVRRGTKVIVHLKSEDNEFSTKQAVEGIVKKYSNFVGFPIYINGDRTNTVDAIWTKNRNEITNEQHKEFYRFIANAYDRPVWMLHYKTDVPIDINALFYWPSTHMERMGMGKLDPGVSLYSRKVLIQPKCAAILPDWLRFIQGVVDSEDIPLNISRESMQDTALIQRIKNVLTKRVITFMKKVAEKNPKKYSTWYEDFGIFIKEGMVSDPTFQADLAPLLRYESTKINDGKVCSLDEYIARMVPGQEEIFYLNAESKEDGMRSPYMEQFTAADCEVLLVTQPVDTFVLTGLDTYQSRKLVSIESSDAKAPASAAGVDKDGKRTTPGASGSSSDSSPALSVELQADLLDYVRTVLKDDVKDVRISDRLVSSPAVIVDHESSAVRRMMKMANQEAGMPDYMRKHTLEINPNHKVMKSVLVLSKAEPDTAAVLVNQIFDNAQLAADLLDNPRDMLSRLNRLLELVVEGSDTAKMAIASNSASDSDAQPTSSQDSDEVEAEVVEEAAAPSSK